MKKRILSIVLAIVMLVTMLPVVVLASEPTDASYFNFDITTGTIIDLNDTSITEVVIPESIDGVPVTSIGEFAFRDCTNLTSITIPNSVTSIGEYAFYYCTSLTSITIPSGVTSIGEFAFYYCTSLTSITIPNSVESIGKNAFSFCTSLTSITIPNNVTVIWSYVFSNCTNLTSITIPASVTHISMGAFYGCSGLKDVYYLDTKEGWDNITIVSKNDDLTGKVRCVGDITQGFSFTQPSNLTYDGKAKEATVTKNNQDYGDFTIKYYDQNGQVYTTGPVDAGTYTVKIDIAASSKYSAISGYEVGQFTIQQAENSFTTDLSIEDWTYGDPPKAPTAEAKFGTPAYSYSTEEDGTYATDQPTNAGTYWVKAAVEETKNYTGLEDKIQFTILPKIYTVTYAAGSNGSGTVTAGSKTHDVAFTLSSDTFTRTGYDQTGWAASDGGEKVYDLGGTYTANEDITLYPVWSDITKPTGEISVGTNKWNSFLNTITFGLFFKDTQTVTITAGDNSGEDVTIEYLLSDKALSKTELVSATFTAYTDSFSINPDNKYVIYAKLTDKSGNVAYINTSGIVLDATAPVITGVENGKTYCEAQTVTVTEDYIESVKVNGTDVTLDENNQFTLNPAEGTQTIVVTDKAGNVSADITVTVNDGHTDNDKNHKCDFCGTNVGVHADNDKDHNCDYCSVKMTTCKDDDKNHICDICSTTLSSHTGGTATCTAKAICEYCGKEYGEIDSSNHNLEKISANNATVTATGNKEYWHCKDCNKYFADENGTNEIKLDDTVIAKLPPEIIDGKGQSITEGESKELTFRSNAAFSDLIRVELDGKTLDEKYYTVKEGSTIVTLKADYVATLSVGEHTIGIVSASGTATTAFTINAKPVVETTVPTQTEPETTVPALTENSTTVPAQTENEATVSSQSENDSMTSPETGNESNMALLLIFLISCGGVIVVTGAYSKRKKHI